MDNRLCPKCGRFALVFTPGYLNEEDAYVCSFCGEKVPAKEAGVALNEDSIQRFPGKKDDMPNSELQTFLERKKK